MKIDFRDVSKWFGLRVAIEDVSFVVKPGEFVFLTGPSGSGKTTILRLITGYYLPEEGEVLVGDLVVNKAKKKEILDLRKRIGMVFQEFKLIPEMSAAENVAVALDILAVDKDKREKKVADVLSAVGLEGKEDLFPAQMSGGELQKTCLARALVVEPEIILADEPTGNLDPAASWELMELLGKINKKGKTVIMATHDVDIVDSFKKRVLQLKKGKLVKDKKKGKY